MNQMLARLVKESRPLHEEGHVATYIPELAGASPETLGVALATVEGDQYQGGEAQHRFSIQSISKIIALALALQIRGEERVFDVVGVHPTPDSFNSIMRLEMDEVHRPYNPLINAGAIAISSLLPGDTGEERAEGVLALARRLAGNPEIRTDEKVYLSEKTTSDRNRSLAYYMRSTGNLEGDVEDILDGYFRQCSIEMSVCDLGLLGATLASGGLNPLTGERVLSSPICRTVRALMMTCGMYDGSGEFALRVGLPAKSGVGGGIVAVVPGRMGIAVCGPALDERGNSICGMKVLEGLSKGLKLSVL